MAGVLADKHELSRLKLLLGLVHGGGKGSSDERRGGKGNGEDVGAHGRSECKERVKEGKGVTEGTIRILEESLSACPLICLRILN